MTTCHTCQTTWTGRNTQHCPACHETFTSSTAGDMHRVGTPGVTDGPNRRRCLTGSEMLNKGMQQNRHGIWASRPMNMTIINNTLKGAS